MAHTHQIPAIRTQDGYARQLVAAAMQFIKWPHRPVSPAPRQIGELHDRLRNQETAARIIPQEQRLFAITDAIRAQLPH